MSYMQCVQHAISCSKRRRVTVKPEIPENTGGQQLWQCDNSYRWQIAVLRCNIANAHYSAKSKGKCVRWPTDRIAKTCTTRRVNHIMSCEHCTHAFERERRCKWSDSAARGCILPRITPRFRQIVIRPWLLIRAGDAWVQPLA